MSAQVVETAECQTLSVKEAAAVLGVAESFLHQRAREHGHVVPGLPIIQIGATRRVPRARLMALAAGEWTPEVTP